MRDPGLPQLPPEPCDLVPVRIRSLQEAAVVPQHLPHLVTRQRREALVHIDERAVFPARVGNRHGVPRGRQPRLEAAGEQVDVPYSLSPDSQWLPALRGSCPGYPVHLTATRLVPRIPFGIAPHIT